MRTCTQQPVQLGTAISITGRDSIRGRCLREGWLLCQKHAIVLVEQNAKLVLEVRGVDFHQHLRVC